MPRPSHATARRFASLAAFAWLAVAMPAPAAETYLKSMATKRTDEGFQLEATFLAPVPQALAFDVLTDFDNFASFAPNVKTSRITKREGNRMVIEQTGTAKFGVAQIPYTSVRQIDVVPQQSIKSVQLQGSMKKVESLMTLAPQGDSTQLKYQIELAPSGPASLVLTPARLEHDIEEQFNALIAEMVKRRN